MSEIIPDKLYFKIGEVSSITGVEPYILRYWESEFKLVKPYRTKSNQRLYRRKDVESVIKIKKMLYDEKFTIAGAKKKIRVTEKSEKQLPLGFSQEKYKQALKEVVVEIKDLYKSIGNN